ncbi:hypothetical protein KCU81_g3211, partial [Aureobasidium melanogenum]
MPSPSSKGRRRSSLSAAFDNFRNKCRRTRIDSLLSPPKLDSGASNDEEESFNSPSDEEGVLLTTNSGDKSPGTRDGEHHEQAESTHSRCDSRLPEIVVDDCSFATGFGIGARDNDTSPDENNRLVSALADFTAEATEPEDFGRYFSLSRQSNDCQAADSNISPTETTTTELASLHSMSRLLQSDDSGSTLEFEIGVPLQRSLARTNLQQEWTTQVQTEPQTQEQSLLQSTYALLDEVVHETVLIEKEKDAGQEEEGAMRRGKATSLMKTVDGVRLDARPLVRHSGTAAPPHSSLQLCNLSGPSSPGLVDTRRQGVVGQPRPQLTSWFSSSSESSTDGIHLSLPSSRRRHIKKTDLSPPSTMLRRKRHQTTHDTRPLLSSPPPFSEPPKHSDITSAPRGTQVDKSRNKQMEYSHTPPSPRPKSTSAYTTLSSASSISNFHFTLNAKLDAAISTGAIKAHQVGVKERVRRLSGARRSLQQGWKAGGRVASEGARRMSGWGRGIGEAVVASGGVGVGWGDVAREGDDDVGRKSATMYYGGGFV